MTVDGLRRRDFCRLGLAGAGAGAALLGSSPRIASAQSAEDAAIATCIQIIRDCQLPDGAFTVSNLGTTPDTPVWVAPYFAQYASLALLARHAQSNDRVLLRSVKRWLLWCAANQDPAGIWYDHEGTRGNYSETDFVDAWDSSASMYLVVLDRYRRQGGVVSDAMLKAAFKSLACLRGLVQPNGLIWGRPDYPVQLFMDLVEVHAGAASAQELFAATQQSARSRQAERLAEQAAAMLPTYWRNGSGLYRWALHDNGFYQGGFADLYPHGTAQLWGCAFVEPEIDAWQATKVTFAPETTPHGFGAEWWLLAASRFSATNRQQWSAAVVADASTFTATNVYILRPSLAVLGLLEGADWMPNLVTPTL